MFSEVIGYNMMRLWGYLPFSWMARRLSQAPCLSGDKSKNGEVHAKERRIDMGGGFDSLGAEVTPL